VTARALPFLATAALALHGPLPFQEEAGVALVELRAGETYEVSFH